MIRPRHELIAHFEKFKDTHELEADLFQLIEDYDGVLDAGDIYTLREIRENLMGLYEICRSFVNHEKKFSEDTF